MTRPVQIAATAIGLAVFGFAWFVGFAVFLEAKPFPGFALEDYGYYSTAFERLMAGGDPYEIRTIGEAYLYPPQALLGVAIFEAIPAQGVKIAAYWLSSIALVIWMILAAQRHIGHRIHPLWLIAFALFLPIWVSTYIGQINLFVAGCILFYFTNLKTRPVLAGSLLAVAVALKVTPALLILLAFRADFKRVVFGAIGTSLALVAITAVFFGTQVFWTFIEVLGGLSEQTVYGTRHISILNVFYLIFTALGWDTDAVPGLQVFVWFCVLTAAGLALWATPRDDLRLAFAIICLAMTSGANVVWLHHFAFLLPALFLLAAQMPGRLAAASMILVIGAVQIIPSYTPDNFGGLMLQACLRSEDMPLPCSWSGLMLQACLWGAVALLLLALWRQRQDAPSP